MPYPATRTFWLEPTDTALVGCRRYPRQSRDAPPCTVRGGFHSAITNLGVAPIGRVIDPHDGAVLWGKAQFTWPDAADPAWPTHCACGYDFLDDDPRQEWTEPRYRRTDTGDLTTLRGADPGALWDAWWLPWKGPDGLSLMVRCPNGHDWMVDSRASNCTLLADDVHRCWIRHGDPRTQPVTVDKNGPTCSAGAGSIVAGDYHGFLQNGILTAG